MNPFNNFGDNKHLNFHLQTIDNFLKLFGSDKTILSIECYHTESVSFFYNYTLASPYYDRFFIPLSFLVYRAGSNGNYSLSLFGYNLQASLSTTGSWDQFPNILSPNSSYLSISEEPLTSPFYGLAFQDYNNIYVISYGLIIKTSKWV